MPIFMFWRKVIFLEGIERGVGKLSGTHGHEVPREVNQPDDGDDFHGRAVVHRVARQMQQMLVQRCGCLAVLQI